MITQSMPTEGPKVPLNGKVMGTNLFNTFCFICVLG